MYVFVVSTHLYAGRFTDYAKAQEVYEAQLKIHGDAVSFKQVNGIAEPHIPIGF